MRSPFPGMDPYLEPRWSSFHLLLLSAIAAQLKRSLPPGLQARPDEEVRVETWVGETLAIRRPDVFVAERDARRDAGVAIADNAWAVEPVQIRYRRVPSKARWISIVDAERSDRVVSAIEILSPTNKRAGRENRAYRRKLRSYERAGVNWVELDLLRSSRKHMAVGWRALPPEQRADYLALSFRAESGALDAYSIGLRSRLPTIRVPLRGPRELVMLDVKAAFDRAWDDGPFDDIDYSKPADPPLSADDAGWLAGLLAARATT